MGGSRLGIVACAAALIVSVGLGGPAWALDPGQPPTVVTTIAKTSVTAAGQPIVPPTKDVHAIASNYEIAPGATLPVHKHPFPRYAYVLGGTLQVTDVESGASTTYKTGDFIVEMVDRWHQGTNIGADPVRLLVIDQVEGDAKETIMRQ